MNHIRDNSTAVQIND